MTSWCPSSKNKKGNSNKDVHTKQNSASMLYMSKITNEKNNSQLKSRTNNP